MRKVSKAMETEAENEAGMRLLESGISEVGNSGAQGASSRSC